jgi:uncharacterized small protein (DUF1192 family)
MDWDDIRKPSSGEVVLGENLERASIAELEARIAALEGEIARVRAEIERKRKIEADAAAIFKS